jgi:tetratricopeptide (TPR) repeat protein
VLDGKQVFHEEEYHCPEAARRENTEGYWFFMAKRYPEALNHYQKAVDLCPEHGAYWITYGDAHFALGNLSKAKALFIEGLQRRPWDRSGLRFLADAELRLGNPEVAYHHAVLAILSDPTYEAGWAFLKDIALLLRGEWKRVPNLRPSVSFDKEGKPRVVLPFDPKKLPEGEVFFWVGLALSEADELRGSRRQPARTDQHNEPPALEGNVSPARLERTRRILESNLEFVEAEIAKDSSKDSKAFRVFANARKAGYLDEAIFILLLNKELASEYVAFREKGLDRLVRYVKTMLAPVPSSPNLPH